MPENGQLITTSFRNHAIAFPDAVDRALAELRTVKSRKGLLDKAVAMAKYAEQLKAGIEIERPIAIGVLKIKAGLGELLPAKPPSEKGRGKKNGNAALPFSKPVIAAYRKLAAHKDKLDAYVESTDDVPTQGEFIRFATGTEKAGAHAHVSLNTGIPEWYTPAAYIEAARNTMGGIDLDPASSKIAQKTVKAKRYFTVEQDGLTKPWAGRVWLNPPYTAGIVDKFVHCLVTGYLEGDISTACLLVNNATDTKWFQLAGKAAAAICFPAGRIKFLDDTGKPGAPLQGQAVLYFGDEAAKFSEHFSDKGFVCHGAK